MDITRYYITSQQTVVVVVLLAVDFWNCRVSAKYLQGNMVELDIKQNVSGRTLVGLRYWNQVCDDKLMWSFSGLET